MDQTPLTITNTDNLNIDLSTVEYNIPASQPAANPAPSATITRGMLEAKSLEELKEFKAANKIPGRAPVTNKAKYIDFIMAWVDAGGVPKAKPATTKKKPAPIPEPDSGDEAGPAVEAIKTKTLTRNIKQTELKPITLHKATKRVLKTLTDAEKADIKLNRECKEKVYSFLDKIHDMLRGSSVAGESAMDDIIMFIMLAKLDTYIASGKFDFFNKKPKSLGGPYADDMFMSIGADYYCSMIDTIKAQPRGFILTYLSSNLHELRGGTTETPDLIMKMGTILKAHDFSKNFIRDINMFHLDNAYTMYEIFKKFNPFPQIINTPAPADETATPAKKKVSKSQENEHLDLSVLDQMDVIGTIYEYFTNKYKGNQGKDMGQYFTERSLMLMSLHLVDREDIVEFGINNDSTMGDEYCGTFGFPLKAREFFAKHYGIEFKPENIYGVEYAPKTFCLASANAMLSGNGAKSYKLTHGSSFVTNMTPHLDFSVHNVPFGDTMRWKDIIAYARDDETKALLTKNIEVKVNVDAVLCAQLVVYKTRKMGILIIKDGKETSSPKFEAFRRSIMDKCIVKKIMKIPSTAFTHTNTKTICIYFIKREGAKTEAIQFCELNDGLDTITEICQVSRADLDARACSWNPQDYLVDEKTEHMKGKSVCEWKKLGDVVKIINGSNITAKELVHGEYPVIGGGQTPMGYHNQYNYAENEIIISKDGAYAGFISKYNTKTYITNHGLKLIPNTELVNKNYVYYLLKNSFQDQIYKLQKGGAQPGIDKNDILRMEIPVPSLEIQKETVAELDELGSDKDALTRYHKNLDNHMKLVVKKTIKENLDTIQWRKLGEVAEINYGTRITQKENTSGEYPVYGGGDITFYTNTFNINSDITCKFGRFGGASNNFVILVRGKFFLNDNGMIVKPNVNYITNKYMCYYILLNYNNNHTIYERLYWGGGQQQISIDSLLRMEIPVPSLEIQQQMVTRMEQFEASKEMLRAEIKKLDDMMKETLEQSYTTRFDSRLVTPETSPVQTDELPEEQPLDAEQPS